MKRRLTIGNGTPYYSSQALDRGERSLLDQALERLQVSLSTCGELNMLPQWWAHRIAIHLLSDLWSSTFHERVPLQPAGGEAADWPRLRELFSALLQRRSKAEVAYSGASRPGIERTR